MNRIYTNDMNSFISEGQGVYAMMSIQEVKSIKGRGPVLTFRHFLRAFFARSSLATSSRLILLWVPMCLGSLWQVLSKKEIQAACHCHSGVKF